MKSTKPNTRFNNFNKGRKARFQPWDGPPAAFQRYRFDQGLGSSARNDLALSGRAFDAIGRDKSMAAHAEFLLAACRGLRLERDEVPGWPW